jgi:hypothetical protein
MVPTQMQLSILPLGLLPEIRKRLAQLRNAKGMMMLQKSLHWLNESQSPTHHADIPNVS